MTTLVVQTKNTKYEIQQSVNNVVIRGHEFYCPHWTKCWLVDQVQVGKPMKFYTENHRTVTETSPVKEISCEEREIAFIYTDVAGIKTPLEVSQKEYDRIRSVRSPVWNEADDESAAEDAK